MELADAHCQITGCSTEDSRRYTDPNCARPYGIPCNHEHACIRCPILQVNPKLLPRLAEIEKNLLLRRKRAQVSTGSARSRASTRP